MASGTYEESRGMANFPKNGTRVPNRIFVGGISGCTNEEDLRSLFSKYGNVKGTKVVFDKAGIPGGYGFVTFETEDEALAILEKSKVERLILKDRKLNVAPAVKKLPYNRIAESNPIQNSAISWPLHYPKNTPGFVRESVYYPQPCPLAWPQYYFDQQCHYPMPQSGFPQYVYPIQATDFNSQPVPQVASTEYVETSSASGANNTKNRAKPAPLPSDNDRSRSVQAKPSDVENTNVIKYNGGGIENATTCIHPAPMPHLHPVLAKTLNGVTVMTYPNPVVMGNPAVLHVKNGNESDAMIKELGFLHPSIASGALTPPPTPLVSFPCDFNVNASVESFRQN